MQTVELLKLSGGTVVALDLFPHMVARVQEACAREQLADRLETIQVDMKDMTFEPNSFDVVWSEGAIYFLGFRDGLARVQDLVKPGGYVAVSEAVWLAPDPPRDVVELWREYPEIDTVENKLAVVSELGYENIGHFFLPASSWTDEYYKPLQGRVSEHEQAWQGIPEAESVLAEARHEIAMFRKYSQYYGYAFFVMRKWRADPGW
jgi:SAM-dependent methyltransferase